MRNLLATVSHYEKKVQESGADLSSASSVMKLISKEIERDGLLGAKEMNDDDPPYVFQSTLSVNLRPFLRRKHSDELGEIGFVRYAYADGLALMPGPDS